MNLNWFRGFVLLPAVMGVFAILMLVFGVSVGLTSNGVLPLAVGIVLCVSVFLGAVLLMHLADYAYKQEVSLAYEQGWRDGVEDATGESSGDD